MPSWTPPWSQLNAIAAHYLASSPLKASIAAATSPDTRVVTGLKLDLADVVASSGAPGTLVVAADTLVIPADALSLQSRGVMLIARSVKVRKRGKAQLTLQGDLQLVTAGIDGTLSVAYQPAKDGPVGAAVELSLARSGTPNVLTVVSGAPSTAETAPAVVADVMHSPWSLMALELSSAIAAVLIDLGAPGALKLSAAMSAWVSTCCRALLDQRDAYQSSVDYKDVTSQHATALAQQSFTEASAAGATYVPVLSAKSYQSSVSMLMEIAERYDKRIAALKRQKANGKWLDRFAGTLGEVQGLATEPLIATLRSQISEAAQVETLLGNAQVQLKQACETLKPLYEELREEIEEDFQRNLLVTAFKVLFTLAELFTGAAAAIVEGAAGGTEALKSALEVAEQLVKAGEEFMELAIEQRLEALKELPSDTASKAVEEGGQLLVGSVYNFAKASNSLWSLVKTALAQNPPRVERSDEYVKLIAALPDLSGFGTGGLHPTTYWNSVVVKTVGSVSSYQDLPAATAYVTAVKLAATYGSAVGDHMMTLLDLYSRALSTYARLVEVSEARARWDRLQADIADQDQRFDAALGLVTRGYINVKRELCMAVSRYRAAFFYQWLQPSSIAVDVTMRYGDLQLQMKNALDSLQGALIGPDTGVLKPRQDFDNVTYVVRAPGGGSLFTEVDGKGQARWTISLDDTALSGQLGGKTALYISEANFLLVGGKQPDQVHLTVATSDTFLNRHGKSDYRFESIPMSMDTSYKPGSSGRQPTVVMSWRPTDKSAFMVPTPYTEWTLTVNEGDWRNVTEITMTLRGVCLQQPT